MAFGNEVSDKSIQTLPHKSFGFPCYVKPQIKGTQSKTSISNTNLKPPESK